MQLFQRSLALILLLTISLVLSPHFVSTSPVTPNYLRMIEERRAKRAAETEPQVQRRESTHEKRTEFPEYPPSCTICSWDYEDISSCANASIVFANIAQILWNPLAFLDVIDCACTDTFRSAYPQCVDCFIQTNQTGFLVPDNGNLSSVVTGIREICALGSAIFGGVASENSQLPGQTPITPRNGVSGRQRELLSGGVIGMVGMAVLVGLWTVW